MVTKIFAYSIIVYEPVKLTLRNPGVEGLKKRHRGGVLKNRGLEYGDTQFLGAKDNSSQNCKKKLRFWISKR